MARIRVDDTEYSVGKADNGHIKGPNEFNVAFRGNPVWFRLWVEQLEKYETIRIEANFDYTPSETNPDEYRNRSKVGIWTAVKDSPGLITRASQSSDTYLHGEQESFSLELDKWKFGQKSQIMFNVTDASYTSSIELAFCAVPFFHARDKGNAKCELNLVLHGCEKSSLYEKQIDEYQSITFYLDENKKPYSQSVELKVLENFKAFKIDGDGNSVHPKQLYTDRALKEQIEDSEAENIQIAYIGTDTTENLVSMIRRFKENSYYYSKLSKLIIYSTEDWDRKITEKFPNLKLDKNISGGLFDIEFNELPKDKTPLKNVEPVDYVIATYVTPWAMADDENKQQYSSLITDLLNKTNAKLISVDPENSSKVIRSYSENFTLQDMYANQLNLKPAGGCEIRDDMVVNWTIWKRKEVD